MSTHTFRLCQSTWYHPGLIYCPNSRNNFNCFGIITGRTCQHVKSLHTWTLPSTSSWFSRKRTLLVKTTKDSSYNYLDIPFSTVYHQNGREGRFLAQKHMQGVFFTWIKLSTYSKPSPLMDRNSKRERIEDPNHPSAFRGELLVLGRGMEGKTLIILL